MLYKKNKNTRKLNLKNKKIKEIKKVNLNLAKMKKKILNNTESKKSAKLLKKIILLKKKFVTILNKNFNFFIFINKLFNSITKNGKKNISINYFLKIFNIVLVKNKTKNKSFYFLFYFFQIALKLIPCFLYTKLKMKGKDLLMPWLKKNKKLNTKKLVILGISWLKKSLKNRKEKTIFLKLFSELEGIRMGSSESINLKNFYYNSFYQNKRYIRYLKKRLWI